MADRRAFKNLVKGGLFTSLFFSFALLASYAAGRNLPDEILLYLLLALRGSSFFMCLFALYLLASCVKSLILKPAYDKAAASVFYLLAILLGASFIFLSLVITVFSEGNLGNFDFMPPPPPNKVFLT